MIPIDGIIPQFANLQESCVLGLEKKLEYFVSICFMFCIHTLRKCSAYEVPFVTGLQEINSNLHIIAD
jgi:hypothetical protein